MENDSSISITRNDEIQEISEQDFESSVLSRIDDIISTTALDIQDKILLISYYVEVKRRHFLRTDRIEDVEESIDKQYLILQLGDSQDEQYGERLDILGILLESRYERTGSMQDLESAIEKAEEAVRATPTDHPNLAGLLSNLGNKLLLSKNPIQALPSFLQAWYCHSSIPSVRLRAAIRAVDLLVAQENWDQAADLAVDAVHLLPVMHRRMLSRDDQQHLLSMFTGLAPKASSLMFQSRRSVTKVVEILELGRGAILGIIIDDRRDITHVRHVCPQEADNYDMLRRKLNTETRELAAEASMRQPQQEQVEVVRQFENCVQRIRACPGLERFLLGPSIEELQQQARNGHIIIVNVTDIRSDAILLGVSDIDAIELPAFSAKTLRGWKEQKLTQFTTGSFGKKNKKYRNFLSFLWKSCVQLVLDHLAKDSSSPTTTESRPRVWWIGTGEASNVPFHAAGSHERRSLDNAFSRVISSYTPSIKTLQFSRERSAQARQTQVVTASRLHHRKLCIVTMPQTPNAADLHGVLDESSHVEKAASSTFFITQLTRPTAAWVREELQTCHVFHFAGHGIANPVDPSQGSLLCYKIKMNLREARDKIS